MLLAANINSVEELALMLDALTAAMQRKARILLPLRAAMCLK